MNLKNYLKIIFITGFIFVKPLVSKNSYDLFVVKNSNQQQNQNQDSQGTRKPSSIEISAKKSIQNFKEKSNELVFSKDQNIKRQDVYSSVKIVKDYFEIKIMESKLDASVLLPTDSENSHDQSLVANKIADKSLKYFWEQSPLKKSQFGQIVEKTENAFKQEVVLRSDKVEHKFNVSVNLFQAQAVISYKGFANADIAVRSHDSSFRLGWTW